MRVQRLVVLAALGCALTVSAVVTEAFAREGRPANEPPTANVTAAADTTDMAVALERTTALQETARLLRNGATAGAAPHVLMAEAARLRENLSALIAAHHRWAAALPEARRTTALEAEITLIEDGCKRMRASLDDLDRTLAEAAIDRASVQTVGQRIGRQARLCARALRRAQRS